MNGLRQMCVPPLAVTPMTVDLNTRPQREKNCGKNSTKNSPVQIGQNSTQSLQGAIDVKPTKRLEIHEWTICEKMEMELRQNVLLVASS